MHACAHFPHSCALTKPFSSASLLPTEEVQGHRGIYHFKGISSSERGHPASSNENVLLGDLGPRFGAWAEVQRSLSRASKNDRFLSVLCPNLGSFEARPGLLGRRSEPQGGSLDPGTREKGGKKNKGDVLGWLLQL